MKKIIAWISASNRYKHLIGGVAIGALSDSDYCAALCGIGVAGALEYKDKAHGGAWDWIDFALTLTGVIVGRLIHIAICGRP